MNKMDGLSPTLSDQEFEKMAEMASPEPVKDAKLPSPEWRKVDPAIEKVKAQSLDRSESFGAESENSSVRVFTD